MSANTIKAKASIKKAAAVAGIKARAATRLDYNENHDERGRFSVGAGSSGSALVEAGEHATKAKADAQAKKNSTLHNGLHTVYDNKTKAYVSSFRGGKEVPLKAPAAPKRIPGLPKTATAQGAREAGQAVRDLQAKTAAAKVGTPIANRTLGYHKDQAAYHRDMASRAADPKAHLETARQHEELAAGIKKDPAAYEARIREGLGQREHLTNEQAGGLLKGGHQHMTAEQFEKTVKTGNFSVLTAANPSSQTLSSRENAERMKQLYNDLHDAGAKFVPTVGRYGNVEPSVMVLHENGFTPEKAQELGKKYGQTSVMHSQKGVGSIHYTTGPREGKSWQSTGLTFGADKKDFYTGHQGNRFSYDFPDEAFPNEKGE